MKNTNYIKNMEPIFKAPAELKQRTFKRIEQISLTAELLKFYSGIPLSFLENGTNNKK